MIQVESLSKSYGQKVAVSDVSFEAERGRVVGLLGPNGAGKTTTMRVILGLDAATSGRALVDGVPYRSHERPLTVVGAQFDGAGAHKGRTARAHLTWVAQSNGVSKGRIDEVLDMVGLSSVARKRVGGFSLGMSQRLGIATALLGDPGILVFDEPTNGLDPEGIRWIRKLFRDLADSGKTVLVSSHLMGEVEGVADDIVVMARGRVVCQGPTAKLVGPDRTLEDAYFLWTEGAGDHTSDGGGS